MIHPLVDFLKSMRSFTPEEELLVAEAFETRTYKNGEYVFRAGQVCREMFFTTDGLIMIHEVKENGNELVHYFLPKNHFLTILPGFYDNSIAKESLIAACPAEALVISRTKLDELCAKLPFLAGLVDRVIQATLMEKVQTRNAYHFSDAATCYKMFLEKQPYVARNVSLGYIASYLGITQQSLSRIRKSMSLS
jgi:CRP-like cAMP-binding protein